MKKKSVNKNLTSFADHTDKEYGKRGTKKREKFEEGFEAFKLGVITNKEKRIQWKSVFTDECEGYE